MRFSVTVPAFKKTYLRECIKSILSQTYQDYEIIVVNDASPEDLDSILSEFTDPRIKYYVNSTGFGGYNVVENWNKCLEYASGDYVICMGDDDCLTPNALLQYSEVIDKYPFVDVFHTRAQIIDEFSNVIGEQTCAPEIESVYSLMWNIWNGRITYIGDFLFKTATLRQIGGFYNLPYAWYSDRMTPFLCAKQFGIVNINVIGFQFRVSRNHISAVGTHSDEKIEAWNHVLRWYTDFLRDKPINPDDLFFWEMLVNNIDKFIWDKKAWVIAEDLFRRHSRISHWVKKRKDMAIGWRMLFKSLYLCVSMLVQEKEIIH